MQKLILLLSILGLFQLSFGQTKKPESALTSLTKIDLGFQGIGFTYEPRLSNKFTADLSTGIGGGYNIAEGSIEYVMFKPAFFVSVTPKYYFNLNKRIIRGKTVKYNSGNYIGARLTFNTPLYNKSDEIRNSILANVHWGIQRAISNRITFNTHVGLGYAQDIDYNFGTVYPALDFKFSYILGSKS